MVENRSAFLSEASRQLSGCLDLRRTLLSALRVVVPELASWAQIALFEPSTITLVTRGPEPTDYPRTVSTPPTRSTHTGLGRIRRSSQTERLSAADGATLDEQALAGLVPDEDLRRDALCGEPVEALGVPLHARGNTLGALVLVRTSGPLDDAEAGDADGGDEDIRFAEDVAGRIAVAIDVARMYEERAHMASVLESSLRPPALPRIDGMRVAARYRPAAEHLDIGGDFFDAHGADGDFSLAIGDVCGKGVEAAVLTGRSRQTIRTIAHIDRSPDRVLTVLNDVLHEADSDRFVTAVCARLRPDLGGGIARVDVGVAGHPPPLVLRADGEVEQVDAHGPLCGVLPDAEYGQTTVWLRHGDTMLFLTDGIYEARGPGGFYGMRRLAELLPCLAGSDPETVCATVEDSVVRHLAGAQHDDMALLAVTCGEG
jgi:serine phosphatase RsbU (regulator of sigma subunit)